MATTYNGRFYSPAEPRGGGKWIVGGLVMIPLWSLPLVGVAALAGSVCCFVKGGKMNAEKRMYQRFHEFCAVIGMRERISFRELMKASGMTKTDLRQYLQKMLAKGYFGPEAMLDLNREELVLPAFRGQAAQQHTGSWKDMVFELLHALRVDKHFQGNAQESHPAGPESEPKTESQPAAQPREAPKQPQEGASVKKTYMDELEKTLNELYQLNVQIEDEAVSRRIDRIGALTAGIFRAVIDNPEREQDVRKFMNYYLPTTLKLLKSYDMLEEQSYQGENIAASRKKIEDVLDMLIEAYEKQLDRLFKNDALDIATDINVLETMMAGDGLSGKGQIKLEL